MRRIYLDNAATSFPKPPEVWDAFRRVAEELGAPAGRSSYGDAVACDQVIEAARRRLGRFFGTSADRVIFACNCTDALNMALKGLLGPGDHVVTTALEHNSVRRPLESLRRSMGIRITTVAASAQGEVSADDVAGAIASDTRLVVVLHASNVCGSLLPVREIGGACRERGVPLLVDAAQTAGARPIDLEADGIDLLAVPGHKGLLGPPGTGALLLRDDLPLRPWREGGTGTRSEDPHQPDELPHRLEAGSPNAPGIAALAAGVEYLERRGLEEVGGRLHSLKERLCRGLAEIPGLCRYGPPDAARREAVFSVNFPHLRPDETAAALDAAFGVQTRSGLHCAPGAHRCLGTFPYGSCRLSPGLFTTDEEIDAAVAALRELAG